MTSSLVLVAWRSLIGNLRRTLLTVAAIAIGLTALIFLWGFSGGLQHNMLANFQDAIVGSLQVHHRGFFKHPELARHIARPEEVTGALASAGIERWTFRLEAFALAAGPESSAGVLLMGMDPAREPRVTRLPGRVSEGRFFTGQDDYACVVGATTARNLGVKLGDPVVLMAYDRFGALSAEEFTLVGIITSGEMGIDSGMVIVPLAAAQEFLEMQGRVTSIPARVPDRRLERLTRELKLTLGEETYEVQRWYDMFPVMKEWVAVSDAFHYVFLGIVLLIVLAGVLNTVLLSMLERTHEFGVLMALGMRQDQVGALVSLESLMMGLAGVLLGTCLGLGLVWVTARVGIDLSVLLGPTERFYVDPIIRPRLSLDHVVYTVTTVFTTTLVAGLYPAHRAARLEPVEAIRHV